jgi:hypothetical protein
MLDAGCWLLDVGALGCWVVGFWLLAFCCWLLTVGCCIFSIDCRMLGVEWWMLDV